MERPRNVLVIGTGAPATEQIDKCVRRAVEKGWQVQVILSANGRRFAERAGIVEALEAMTGRQVLTDYAFPESDDTGESRAPRPDIAIADVDAVIVAPASANHINHVARGLQPQLDQGVTIQAISVGKPVTMVPYSNDPIISFRPSREAIEQLKDDGVEMIEIELHQPQAPEKAQIPWDRVIDTAERLMDERDLQLRAEQGDATVGRPTSASQADAGSPAQSEEPAPDDLDDGLGGVDAVPPGPQPDDLTSGGAVAPPRDDPTSPETHSRVDAAPTASDHDRGDTATTERRPRARSVRPRRGAALRLTKDGTQDGAGQSDASGPRRGRRDAGAPSLLSHPGSDGGNSSEPTLDSEVPDVDTAEQTISEPETGQDLGHI